MKISICEEIEESKIKNSLDDVFVELVLWHGENLNNEIMVYNQKEESRTCWDCIYTKYFGMEDQEENEQNTSSMLKEQNKMYKILSKTLKNVIKKEMNI